MAKKKRQMAEYRYYKMPGNAVFFALQGERWRQKYEREIDFLHFHNFLEIGFCYSGSGVMTLGEQDYEYHGGDFTVIPSISTPFLIMMFRQNSRNFPVDTMEAARIDGLNEIQIFFRMYMPMMKSTYAAAAVITFMNAWNSYLWPKVIMTQPEAQTMPMLIANMSSGYTTDYGMLMVGVLFCSVPTMVVFFVLQKQFAEGITGAVK